MRLSRWKHISHTHSRIYRYIYFYTDASASAAFNLVHRCVEEQIVGEHTVGHLAMHMMYISPALTGNPNVTGNLASVNDKLWGVPLLEGRFWLRDIVRYSPEILRDIHQRYCEIFTRADNVNFGLFGQIGLFAIGDICPVCRTSQADKFT